MTQHAELTAKRWSEFDRGQQLLQIAAEMHRATRWVRLGDADRARAGYERVLRLVDLTVEVQHSASLRRELLRWRDLAAELYVAESPSADAHRSALRVLLQLHPATAAQIDALGA
ncbi:MAG: hypothetical protein HZA52_13225 [Planctomycetes bacterium]|nr:hypothetical protein [Planctomycetota bacterium]